MALTPHDDRPLHAATGGVRRRLALALALAVATAVLEIAGSLLTGSLALLADAGHVLGDAGALTLALGAVWFASRAHSLRWTFGYHRADVLAATLNGLTLLAVAAFIAWRAAERLRAPVDVDAAGLTLVAGLGLIANVAAVLILRGPQSVNVRAARLHVLSDLGGSVVAVNAGVLIGITGETRIDPLLSLVIVALVVIGALRLLRETFAILMARVPAGIDLAEVDVELRSLAGVVAVHDMHCWTITSGFVAFVCHLQLAPSAGVAGVVEAARTMLRERFGIDHVTVQPEVVELHQLAELASTGREEGDQA